VLVVGIVTTEASSLLLLLFMDQFNVAVSIHFTLQPVYLDVLLGSLITFVCLVMFCVAIEAPAPVVSRLENSAIGSTLFTFRGRYMVDLLISLFLFAMGVWGVIMGFLTLFLIFGIRFLGVKQPDAFNEIFRQSDIETQSQGDSYTWKIRMTRRDLECTDKLFVYLLLMVTVP
jgi:hypothetical protein